MASKFAKNVFITGANRGLGLELVKKFADNVNVVFAGCRNPAEAKELNSMAKDFSNIEILQLDVEDEESINKCVDNVSRYCGENGLACLINNAGIMYKDDDLKLVDISNEKLLHTFSINTFAPTILSKKFLPLLQTASKNQVQNIILSNPLIVNMSSSLGSVNLVQKNHPGYYSYRMSKAALNMLTRLMAFELEEYGINVVGIHPGWVKTDMGGPNATLTPEKAVNTIFEVLSNLKPEKYGFCLNHMGDVVQF